MAQPSQFATALLDETVQTFNGDLTAISPTDGISLIDNWISALHSGDESTNPVAHTLSELKIQLQQNSPNGGQIQLIIDELAGQTMQAAQQVDGEQQASLTHLASSLQQFGEQLAGGSSSGSVGGDSYGASGADAADGGSYGSGYGSGTSGAEGTRTSD